MPRELCLHVTLTSDLFLPGVLRCLEKLLWPSSVAVLQLWSPNEMYVICLSLQKEPSEQPELQYDEFGFKVDTEGNVFTHLDI